MAVERTGSEWIERRRSRIGVDVLLRPRSFIVKTKDVNLIVECEDFDGDKSGSKEAKRHYLKDYWLPAANNLKTYGQWQLLEVKDIDRLEEEILKAI